MSLFGQAKPLASLSGGLLARKGGARPAMRPQGYSSLAPTPQQLDDLGWNDMGGDDGEAPVSPPVPAPVEMPTELPPEVPQVLVEREPLADAIETPSAVRTVSVATATRLRRETAHVGRAAFTLRLDAERHLKLRLASAVAHQSAQALVAHALDQFLGSLPEVDALVAQLPPPTPGVRKKRQTP